MPVTYFGNANGAAGTAPRQIGKQTMTMMHQFTVAEARKGGVISGQHRRQLAAERALRRFEALLLVAEHLDKQAGAAARRFDRLAGAR